MAQAPDPNTPSVPMFTWGGRSWTARDLPAFKVWLRAHGLTYDQWAANHSAAAHSVFGVGATPEAVGGAQAAAGGAASASVPPDYASLIESDPSYRRIAGDLSAQSVSDAASRAAAIKSLLIGYGEVPDIASVSAKLGLNPEDMKMLEGDISPDVGNLAQQNTNEGTSLVSRLLAAHADAQRRVMDALGASGLFHSGATAKLVGDEQLGYKNSREDALRQLLAAFGGTIGSFNEHERARRAQVNQALTDAAARAQAAAGSTVPVAATPTATTPTAAQSAGVTPTQGTAAAKVAAILHQAATPRVAPRLVSHGLRGREL